MYKINGAYYVFVTRPADAEFVLKSDSPFGLYEMRALVDRIPGPVTHAGFSHQGGIVDTVDNNWYYVAFMDAYPGGWIPVAASLTWTDDGWPEVVTDADGNWGTSYPIPVQTGKTVAPPVGTDELKSTELSHDWEWNHNPDDSKWELIGAEGGLIPQTATVTDDLFSARNTRTHRVIGPKSMGIFRLDVSEMAAGDWAGAALFRDIMAYIGVWKDNCEVSKLVMVNNLNLTMGTWTTNSAGTVAATGPTIPVNSTDLWLQVRVDVTPAFGTTTLRIATFWYSADGESFIQVGPDFPLMNTWNYFTGYRYAVFNHATKALGGEIKAKRFTMDYA